MKDMNYDKVLAKIHRLPNKSKVEKAARYYAEWLLDNAKEEGETPATTHDWCNLACYGDTKGYNEARSDFNLCYEASANGNFLYYDDDLIERLLTKKEAKSDRYTDSEYLIELQAKRLLHACVLLSFITRGQI